MMAVLLHCLFFLCVLFFLFVFCFACVFHEFVPCFIWFFLLSLLFLWSSSPTSASAGSSSAKICFCARRFSFSFVCFVSGVLLRLRVLVLCASSSSCFFCPPLWVRLFVCIWVPSCQLFVNMLPWSCRRNAFGLKLCPETFLGSLQSTMYHITAGGRGPTLGPYL